MPIHRPLLVRGVTGEVLTELAVGFLMRWRRNNLPRRFQALIAGILRVSVGLVNRVVVRVPVAVDVYASFASNRGMDAVAPYCASAPTVHLARG